MALFESRARLVRLSCVPVFAALALGCSGKDAEKCAQGLSVTRQALAAQDFALAKQWREYSYKQCEDEAALAALDKEIAEREAGAAASKAAADQKKQETTQLLKIFTDFVAQHRTAPDRASAAPVCDPAPEKPRGGEESKDRFCTASRAVGNYTIQVRYWQADPSAFRFSVRPDEPVTCEALGPSTVGKTWDVPAVGGAAAKRYRCDMGGALSGLHAVVSDAKADVHVFSPQYLERDPAMRPFLQGP